MKHFAPIPPAAVSRVLTGFGRHQLEAFVAVAIELMDLADGDPDEENATDLEDDFAFSPNASGYFEGPGCPISDPDACVTDGAHDWDELEEDRA